ncbi:MAG: YcaO-like family protein [Devosia sp.]|uniref:YcaO-like family protein n=1 Tax=Devosia sp. TaxID=1871048 RepID=UPI001AC1B4B3|nr:YcaO-like family protein [Devosia sp.]MBN9317819.1 YcaO-like family protein [Devosia sp.]
MHFARLGITRLARQTGLDRIGIPCYAAIRPNSATIASHQGKGMDDVSAQISAVMEAAEYAIAEAPRALERSMSLAELEAAGTATMDVGHLLPRGAVIDPHRPLRWVEGVVLETGSPILVPYDAVALGPPPSDLPGIAQSTNGIAAGTTQTRALIHAMCEVIERDAVCLWGFKSDAAAAATAVAPAAFDDADVDALDFRIAEAGFRLRLYDQTSNTGLPVIYAVLSPDDGAEHHFDAATGASCHPIAAVAARRAIVEAAQTRITNIAGARDDIVENEYEQHLSRSIAVLTETPLAADRPAPAGLTGPASEEGLLTAVRAGLMRVGLGGTIVIPLGGEDVGIHVVKVFVPGLEDRLTNRNWRPGRRAAAAMLGF